MQTTITRPDTQDTPASPPDPVQGLVDAARAHAARMKITPRWAERLTPEARRLVEAVDALDRAAVTRVTANSR